MTQPDEIRAINGSPRYHHKTTNLINWANDTPEPTLVLADQHQLAEEICNEHLGPTKYGIDADRIVWVQGKERACPNCNHEITGDNYYKVEFEAKNALEQHRVVRPEVVSDVCPYAVCKAAAKYADWVVTVPEMLDRIDVTFSDYNVLIDEESTQKKFLPKETKIFELRRVYSDMMPYSTMFTEDLLDDNDGLDHIEEKVQNKIDELERVPSRYRNIVNAIHALKELRDRLGRRVNLETPEDAVESLEQVEVPELELLGTGNEVTKTFEYLRKNFGRYNVESAIETMLSDPKIHVQKSQDVWNVYLIPDPESGILIQKKVFERCKRLGIVGDQFARWFLEHLVDNPDQYVENIGDVQTINLDIAVIESDNEMDRRHFMTSISKELSDSEVHNLLICGSSTRAAQAHERTSPRSYFFRGGATLEEYQVPADGNWTVVSYMGSRLTRGIDVDTQVTVVRSTQFASPRWHYYEDDQRYKDLRTYENLIETHNAMLRGAAQGEEHIAIVPALETMFFGLQEYVTPYTIERLDDVVNFVLAMLGIISDSLFCDSCGRTFVTRNAFKAHDCDEIVGVIA